VCMQQHTFVMNNGTAVAALFATPGEHSAHSYHTMPLLTYVAHLPACSTHAPCMPAQATAQQQRLL
jgi:hypothetical protein